MTQLRITTGILHFAALVVFVLAIYIGSHATPDNSAGLYAVVIALGGLLTFNMAGQCLALDKLNTLGDKSNEITLRQALFATYLPQVTHYRIKEAAAEWVETPTTLLIDVERSALFRTLGCGWDDLVRAIDIWADWLKHQGWSPVMHEGEAPDQEWFEFEFTREERV